MDSKRIFIVGRYVATYGGAHKYLERLNRKLAKAGHQVWIALNKSEQIASFARGLEADGAVVFDIPFDTGVVADASALLDRHIADVSPDVIDCEVAARTVRNALISSNNFSRSSAKKIFTMHLAIKSEKAPQSIYSTYFPWSAWRKSLRELRKFLDYFDEGISVSQYHAERIVKLLGVSQDFFEFIPNGVDISEFPIVNRQWDNSEVIIGGCGSLTSQKRFDLLLEAVHKLVGSGKSIRCRIAGDGPNRDSLLAQVAKLGIVSEVEFLGHCDDVPAFLRDLDVFVMCSDNEGFPYAQLEAMASGLPSVVTRVGDLPVLVQHNQEGFVVEPRNALELSSRLEQLIDSQEMRRTFGSAARKRVEEEFNADIQEVVTLTKFED